MVAVGAASDPPVAREMIRNLDPDVLRSTSRCRAWTASTSSGSGCGCGPMPVPTVSTLTVLIVQPMPAA